MKLYFVTTNEGKFKEARALLGSDLLQLRTEIDEIQDLDIHEVIAAKLREARRIHKTGDIIVDDTSLELEALNGLPGTLIKAFETSLSYDDLADIVIQRGKTGAKTICALGHMDTRGNITFFEGTLEGTIVKPRGSGGHGFDVIFQPEDSTKTMAEMTLEEKNAISHRAQAFEKLKAYLNHDAH